MSQLPGLSPLRALQFRYFLSNTYEAGLCSSGKAGSKAILIKVKRHFGCSV